jgi:cellobiose-specific phosphotransferase system component IIC
VQINHFIILFIMAVPVTVEAYIGPGMGVGTFAAVFGVLISFFLAIVAVVYYPIKRMLKKKKENEEKKNEESKESEKST